jgi:outer membrane protein assembly factor BamD
MRKLAILLTVSCLFGCAHVDSPGDVKYAKDAKGNYTHGEEALKDGRYQEALKYFEHIRYKFPYSDVASLADLGVADANFDREKFVEAIEGYRSFLKLHPNHPKADYASFRIALCYFKDCPSDFILFPPSTEKDQTSVRQTRTALDDFLRDWPKSSYVPEAQKMLGQIRGRLAKHELSVADFYIRRKHWQAAVSRLNRLLTDYPGTEYEPSALLMLGHSYVELGDKEKAREALRRLLQQFPSDTHRTEAERLLKSAA